MTRFATADTPGAAQAEAALALGRLDGALRLLPDIAQRLLAARLLRDTLIAALRQEGHAVSDQRFLAWFAGLVSLTEAADAPVIDRRPPRALVTVLLTALSDSRWPALATLAAAMRRALLAIPDHALGSGHGEAHEVMAEARDVLATLRPDGAPLPFATLARLHHAVARHSRFAPEERAATMIGVRDHRLLADRPPAPSPRWALESLLGDHWQAAGWLHHALPLAGLIRLDALEEGEDGEARLLQAEALHKVAAGLDRQIDETRALSARLEGLMADRRSNSRLPALFELLAGFGGLRIAQLEVLLGATRLGVRKMLDTLKASGVLTRTTLAGVHLYDIKPAPGRTETTLIAPSAFAFSSDAVADYDAAMAHADALLARWPVVSPKDEL